MSAKATNSLRLILEYDGDRIRLVKEQEVSMAPPPSAGRSAFAENGAFWLEVRDAG